MSSIPRLLKGEKVAKNDFTPRRGRGEGTKKAEGETEEAGIPSIGERKAGLKAAPILEGKGMLGKMK